MKLRKKIKLVFQKILIIIKILTNTLDVDNNYKNVNNDNIFKYFIRFLFIIIYYYKLFYIIKRFFFLFLKFNFFRLIKF